MEFFFFFIMDHDAYAVLGVEPTDSASVIRAAYLRLARQYHPDKAGASYEAECMQHIVRAYETLCDPASRAAYDQRTRQEHVQVRVAETVSVDDMDMEEETMQFVYPCRCGQMYAVAADAIVQGTRYVACAGCSETIHIVLDDEA